MDSDSVLVGIVKAFESTRTVFWIASQPVDSIGRRVTFHNNYVLATRLATRLWIPIAGAYFCDSFWMISKNILIVPEESMDAL